MRSMKARGWAMEHLPKHDYAHLYPGYFTGTRTWKGVPEGERIVHWIAAQERLLWCQQTGLDYRRTYNGDWHLANTRAGRPLAGHPFR